ALGHLSIIVPITIAAIFFLLFLLFGSVRYATLIITVVYAVYFTQVVAAGDPRAAGWWGTALAVSQLGAILLGPLLGALADALARKKAFLLASAVVCSLGTAALALAGPGEIALALGLVIVANLAFSLGENLCAAFLPELSTPETAGRISAYGWSFGYCGGLLSLVLALVMLQELHWPAPWTFLMTGAFFLGASLPTQLLLRERATPRPLAPGESLARLAFAQLGRIRRELPRHRTLAVFFGAMTLFLAGLSAVVAFAAVFATQALGMTQPEIIQLFILLQIAGVAGALGFGYVQDQIGAKIALIASLALWTGVCIWAWRCAGKTEFFLIGILAGAAMGSLQSASRAVVATLTPVGRAGEFFGYWGFFGKLAGIVGPLAFGWMTTATDVRQAILLNAGFFLAGLLVLLPLSLDHRPTRDRA
ncbi:MFS transporter, partial [bacterium]|nr:MFS transporter [bacterium]